MLLAGKVALVTGASRGIGRAIALSLADAGADLVLTATQGAKDTCRDVVARKRRAISVAADISKPKDLDQLVAEAQRAFGQVDVLVNNAAVAPRRLLADMEDSEFDRVLAVNLAGPFYLCRRLVPDMVKRGWGRVVNVSSISGTLGTPRLTAYCASKWGMNGLTQAMASELKGTGVCINAVLPGSVDTDMLKGSGFKPDMTSEDIAGVVRYLCAEAPSAMNGRLVEVFS